MVTLYCDESYSVPDKTTGKPQVCAVAGFLGNQTDWLYTADKWEKCLQHHDDLPYFRASECETLVGAFARFRENPKDVNSPLSAQEKKRRTDIKKAFVEVVVNASIVGFGAAVLVNDLQNVIRSYPQKAKEFENPYLLCCQFAMSAAGYVTTRVNHERRVNNILSFVFEQNEYAGLFPKIYQEFQEKNPYISEYMGSYSFVPWFKYVPLQTADLLAYETMKVLFNSLEYPTLKTRNALREMQSGVQSLYRLDYDTLSAVVEQNLTGESLEKIVKGKIPNPDNRDELRRFFSLTIDQD